MFQPLPSKVDFPDAEKEVLSFWKARDIFHRSLELRKDAPRFVFYEGPPTANGLPHPGHALTRAMKDLFPRYRTMTGHLCERKAGWDTHGLPVETEVSKELGIHTKEEIEAYGVEPFIRHCIESVFRYTREWEEFSDRLGFWVDTDNAYATFHRSYVESVWWSLKTLFERGLLYEGHKVVWWWPQGGTALSAGEVGEGYREVDDPSVYVRFPLLAESLAGRDLPAALQDASLLVWTTTPWTLVSNHFAAVREDFDYAVTRDAESGEHLVIAAELVEAIAAKAGRALETVATLKGADLVGLRYRPPFPDLYFAELGERTAPRADGGEAHVGWRVLAADFVTLESGTGLVHEAPAFGEVDFDLHAEEAARFANPADLPLLCAVRPDGNFNEEAGPDLVGKNIKAADKEIIADMRERGLLFHRESYRHDYPFCPRADEDPLIQYARASWFVRTSQFKDEFLANNAEVQWLPGHIKDGRFGDFLSNNVDWALSRERFWGTPLPVWRCEATGFMEAFASFDELLSQPDLQGREVWEAAKADDPDLPEDLQVHRPYIDALHYQSPKDPDARMRRVVEVIDCWWDAGSMPFAQWGFPHVEGSREKLWERYPADFISEAIDQTRGWFYGLMSINTMLWGEGSEDGFRAGGPEAEPPHPYKACITLAHVMGEDGKKMSKSKKNYREPAYVFDTYGADAMRWYFFSAQPPWTPVQFKEENIRDAQRDFLVRLYNVFSFFNIYANIDGFAPGEAPGQKPRGWRPAAKRAELDRWIISELHRTTHAVRTALDGYENYPAAGALRAFVDGLSNWYVRRSRDRFWRATEGASAELVQDKWDAYNTLHEVLVALAKLIAPFTPFLAERIYRNLVAEPAAAAGLDGSVVPESVHLCDYPEADAALVDEDLSRRMDLVRQVVSLGHKARADAGVKVRQPLAEVEVVLSRPEDVIRVERHAALIGEELNVKQVAFAERADDYVAYELKPNFRVLGPRFGKRVPRIAAAMRDLDDLAAAEARAALATGGRLSLTVDGETVELSGDEVEVRLESKPGWSAAQGRAGVVVVDTEIDEALQEEGVVRELIHHVQAERKELDLPYQARIALHLRLPEGLVGLVERQDETIRREVLADEIVFGEAPSGVTMREASLDDETIGLAVTVRTRSVKA